MTQISEISVIAIDFFSAPRIAAGNVSQSWAAKINVPLAQTLAAPGAIFQTAGFTIGGFATDKMVRIFAPYPSEQQPVAAVDANPSDGKIGIVQLVTKSTTPVGAVSTPLLINLGTGATENAGLKSELLVADYFVIMGAENPEPCEFLLPAGDYFNLSWIISSYGNTPTGTYTFNAAPRFTLDDMQG